MPCVSRHHIAKASREALSQQAQVRWPAQDDFVAFALCWFLAQMLLLQKTFFKTKKIHLNRKNA